MFKAHLGSHRSIFTAVVVEPISLNFFVRPSFKGLEVIEHTYPKCSKSLFPKALEVVEPTYKHLFVGKLVTLFSDGRANLGFISLSCSFLAVKRLLISSLSRP